MRHRKTGRKLNRNSSHRKAMFSNMVASLVTKRQIKTTEAKAKELRGIAEKVITWGVSVSDIQGKEPGDRSIDERNKLVHAKRMAGRVLRDMNALDTLFKEVAQDFVGRPGGYTRVIKAGQRRGDAAPMAYIQLVA